MKIKKIFSVILCISIFIGSVTFSASSSDGLSGAFTFSAKPEYSSYNRGDVVVFKAEIKNDSLTDFNNWFVWMEYDAGSSFLAPKATEHVYEEIIYGESVTESFRLYESDNIISFSDKLTDGASKAFLRLCFQIYGKITKAYVYLKNFFNSLFSGYPIAAEKVKLGESSVIYDGEIINVSFYGRVNTDNRKTVPQIKPSGELLQSFEINSEITASRDLSAVVFSAHFYDDAFDGYFFTLDPLKKEAVLASIENGKLSKIGQKNVTIKDGEKYSVKIQGNDEKTTVYLYNNSLDDSPYPVFEFPLASFGDKYGTIGDSYINSVTECDLTADGETYTNPVFGNSADPYVLKYNGVYYLYSTNAASQGFNVYTSKDLVNWSDSGRVATKGDIYGNGDFWAPEVYYYNGMFYMLYTTDECIAMATSDSPLGPFVKTKEGYYLPDDTYSSGDSYNIDGHIFFDDDGKIYLYFSVGEAIIGCELNDDLMTVKEGTYAVVTSVADNEGTINEGPFVLKHNGKYYLTYSIMGYGHKNYGVAYAVSDSPLGSYTKAENNPILAYNSFVYGPGHHCFTYSPDGNEMFMVYHSHYSTTQIHPRKLCIDRVKFVPTESGIDDLVVYGPTVTPQPVPSK
ncbi:MAG: glycoside hydrolase family 43 protein [Acutalibacteraceae bacterium]